MDLALLVSSLSRQDGTTRHSQQEALYRSLRNMLLDGHIPPGTRLVSTRVLAAELGIARNSAVYAYERLAEEGFVAATRNGTITRWDGCGRSTMSRTRPGPGSIVRARAWAGERRSRTRTHAAVRSRPPFAR